jgi:glyoxylase-like metal-dependent hydrolase (beta-lactamase superfamily II)
MIYRRIELAEVNVTLEQIELQGGTRITCIPDLGPVQWPRDQLLRSPMDAALRRAINHAPLGTVEPDGSTVKLSFNIYLIQSQAGTILVDAGIGNGKTRIDRPAWHRLDGPSLKILSLLGAPPANVNFVINTHLHADHVGWNTVPDGKGQWLPTFTSARYVTSAVELEALMARAETAAKPQELLHGAWADSILPIIEGPGYQKVRAGDQLCGLEFLGLPGHTAGMLGLLLKSGSETVVFSADAIHHPIQLANGASASNFCADPARSITTRLNLLERCATERLLLAPYHFPDPAFGYIERTANGYLFQSVRAYALQ